MIRIPHPPQLDDHEGTPFLTEEQMREVDRLMIEEYGIVLLQR